MESTELNALLTRIDTAKRLTTKLLESSCAFAGFLEIQMDDLGASELMNNKYRLITHKTSFGSDTSLYMRASEDSEYDLAIWVKMSVEQTSPTHEEFYLYGDFNASYNLPNRGDVMEFLGDAPDILNELADMSKPVDLTVVDNYLAANSK